MAFDSESTARLVPRHTAWWLATLVAVLLAGVVGYLGVTRAAQERELASIVRRTRDLQSEDELLRSRLAEFNSLIGGFRGRREDLLRQIARCEQEMQIIGERTRGLEQLRDALDGLNVALERHADVEARFLRNLDKLQATDTRQ